MLDLVQGVKVDLVHSPAFPCHVSQKTPFYALQKETRGYVTREPRGSMRGQRPLY